MSVVVLERLTKRYGSHVGVEGLDLAIPAGCLFGFLGPNGSGKTTAIRVLLGLLRPSAGAARIFGRDCWRESHAIKANVGYMPGDVRLYPWLTCRTAASILGGARRRDLTSETLGLAEDFGLEPDQPVRRMSRGTRQKLALIMAMAHRPALLVMDEPSSGLDPLIQERLFDRLRGLARAGSTVFFSSHTLSEVDDLCDRVGILRSGRLVEDQPLEALRAKATRAVTIVWRDGAATDGVPPPFLENVRRAGDQWQAVLRGPSVEVVRWCAGRPVADVSIDRPNLAELFRDYYRPEESRIVRDRPSPWEGEGSGGSEPRG